MLSIISPTFNEEKVIEKTLRRLKESLTLPHEVIICDDNSTDRTAEIARRYADQVVTRPASSPHVISAARNAGARASQGEILAFFDADFYLPHPDDFFKIALERFKREPRLVALTGPVRAWAELETPIDRIFLGIINASIRFQNNVLHTGEAMGKIMLMRRSAFDAVGGFREDLITREDGDMFKRLARIGETRFDPRLTVYNTWRRAHQLGWIKLMSIWMFHTFYVGLFNKSFIKEWKAVR